MVNPAGTNKKSRKEKNVTISGGIIGKAGDLSRVLGDTFGKFFTNMQRNLI